MSVNDVPDYSLGHYCDETSRTSGDGAQVSLCSLSLLCTWQLQVLVGRRVRHLSVLSLQVAQNVKILPPTIHPRTSLSEEQMDAMTDLAYIPVYTTAADMPDACTLPQPVAILEALMPASGTMLLADLISSIGGRLEQVQLSLSNPLPPPQSGSLPDERRKHQDPSRTWQQLPPCGPPSSCSTPDKPPSYAAVAEPVAASLPAPCPAAQPPAGKSTPGQQQPAAKQWRHPCYACSWQQPQPKSPAAGANAAAEPAKAAPQVPACAPGSMGQAAVPGPPKGTAAVLPGLELLDIADLAWCSAVGNSKVGLQGPEAAGHDTHNGNSVLYYSIEVECGGHAAPCLGMPGVSRTKSMHSLLPASV